MSRKIKKGEHTLSFSEGDFKSIEEFPSIYHDMVMPLLLIKGDEFKVIGTAFIINTQAALAVTAAHCIYEAYGDISRDRQITEEEGVLYLGYFSNKSGEILGGITQVDQLYIENSIDIAILKTRVPVPKGGTLNDSLLTRLLIDFAFPEKGDQCLIFGYNKDTQWKKRPGDDNFVDVTLNLKASQGKVEELIFDGAGGYFKHPMFRINARVDCGMSGGPVISGKSGAVVGIVSRGFQLLEGEFEGYTEHISHTCGLLPICLTEEGLKMPFFEIVNACKEYSTPFFNELIFIKDEKDLKIVYPSGHTLHLQNYQLRFNKQ